MQYTAQKGGHHMATTESGHCILCGEVATHRVLGNRPRALCPAHADAWYLSPDVEEGETLEEITPR